MNQEQYIDDRLDDQMNWYDKKSQFNQKWHKLLKIIEIISAASITFLAGMSKDITYSEWYIGILGILIAVSSGASSLYKFQENWIQYRTTAETLKHEKFKFLTKAEPYRDDSNAFLILVDRIESLLSKENTQWSLTAKKDVKAKT